MNNIKFSIIIPTYNSAATIFNCLKSILNQSFNNFEILVMDGLSKDSTLSIVNSFNDDRIKIYREQDLGVYDAMNKGISYAKGEWLYFLGSDDELYEKFILKKINSLSESNIKIIYGNVIIDQDAGWAKNGQIYDGYFSKEKIIHNNICHQSIFYHKDVFNSIGLYNLKYPINADHDLNIRGCALYEYHYVDLIIAKFKGGGLSYHLDPKFKTDFDNIVIDNHLALLYNLRISNKNILKRGVYNFTRFNLATTIRLLSTLIKKYFKINIPERQKEKLVHNKLDRTLNL